MQLTHSALCVVCSVCSVLVLRMLVLSGGEKEMGREGVGERRSLGEKEWEREGVGERVS